MLVIISAKKKCLNFTVPKGDTTIWKRTLTSSFLDFR
jgi:hypothetical protein